MRYAIPWLFVVLISSLALSSSEEPCTAKLSNGTHVPCSFPFFHRGNTFHECDFVLIHSASVCHTTAGELGVCDSNCPSYCPQDYWECLGSCVHLSEACGNNTCYLEVSHPGCGGVCKSLLELPVEDRIGQRWQCDGRCQPVTRPCHGACPFPLELDCLTNTCYEVLLQDSTSYQCNGECQSKSVPCNGSCYVNPTRAVSSFQKCQGQDVCVPRTKVCNRYEEDSTKCPDLSEFSKETCEDPEVQGVCSRLGDVQCRGARQAQCISRFQICDGVFDCMDRSDESGCVGFSLTSSVSHLGILKGFNNFGLMDTWYPNGSDTGTSTSFMREICIEERLSVEPLEVLIPCDDFLGSPGYRLGLNKNETEVLAFWGSEDLYCFSYDQWCSPLSRIPNEIERTCPELSKIFDNHDVCTNMALWKDKPCGEGRLRCSGNHPGTCYNSDCQCDHNCKAGCPDNSHLVCDASQCSDMPPTMAMCSDNSTCLHKSLFCDGHVQCPDGSDEDVELCGTCPNQYSQSPEQSFSCKHKFTGNKICVIPCDGKDDFCQDVEDEDCQLQSGVFIVVVLVIVVIVLLGISEPIYRESREHQEDFVKEPSEHFFDFMAKFRELLAKEDDDPNDEIWQEIREHYVPMHDQEASSFSDHITAIANAIYVLEVNNLNKFNAYNYLYTLEVEVHNGDELEAERCIKKQLGTTELAMRFMMGVNYSNCNSTLDQMFLGIKEPHKFFALFPTIFVTFVASTAYVMDMVIDIIPLITLSSLVSLDNSSFGAYHLVLMTLAIILTEIIKIPLYLGLGMHRASPTWGKVLGVLFPLVPAASQYVAVRHKLGFLKSVYHCRGLQNSEPSILFFLMYVDGDQHGREFSMPSWQQLQLLANHQKKSKQWRKLRSLTRLSESVIETFYQVTSTTLIYSILSTNTATVHGIVGSFDNDLISYIKEAVIALMIFQLAMAFTFSHIGKQDHATPIIGRFFLFLYYLLSILVRVSALVLYLAPSLGLFDLLWHWKLGSMPARQDTSRVYDVKPTGNSTFEAIFFLDVWKPVDRIEDLTLLPSWFLLASLLVLFLFHISQVLAIKITRQSGFTQQEHSGWYKVFHVLGNFCCPLGFKEWHSQYDDRPQDFMHTWLEYCAEMKFQLYIFAVEHVVMCAPMWILAWNISVRNQYLEQHFGLLEEETLSTNMSMVLSTVPVALYVTVPFLQWYLLKCYFAYGHPWSRIWQREMGRGPHRVGDDENEEEEEADDWEHRGFMEAHEETQV